MNIQFRFVAAAIAGIALAISPAISGAETVYFLVGVRHVYKIGADRDFHLTEREEIEKNYADGISADQEIFNQHVEGGADRDKESGLLNGDLDALADARENSLGALYQQCDSMRDGHPELQIQGDGPYQVVGVDMTEDNGVENYDRYIVYAPWPGYIAPDGCYGNWDYGVWYTPGLFFNLYLGWFDLWPGGRFWGGFCSHSGPFAFRPHGFNDRWHGGHGGFGRPLASGGFNRSGASRGYTHSSAGSNGFSRSDVARGGYSHPSGAGAYSRGSSYSHSGYTHSNGSSFSRSSSYGHESFSRGVNSESYVRGGTERSNSFGGRSYSGSSNSGRSYGGSTYRGGEGRSYSGRSSGGSSGSSRGGSSGRSSGSSGRGR